MGVFSFTKLPETCIPRVVGVLLLSTHSNSHTHSFEGHLIRDVARISAHRKPKRSHQDGSTSRVRRFYRTVNTHTDMRRPVHAKPT